MRNTAGPLFFGVDADERRVYVLDVHNVYSLLGVPDDYLAEVVAGDLELRLAPRPFEVVGRRGLDGTTEWTRGFLVERAGQWAPHGSWLGAGVPDAATLYAGQTLAEHWDSYDAWPVVILTRREVEARVLALLAADGADLAGALAVYGGFSGLAQFYRLPYDPAWDADWRAPRG